MRVVCFIIFLEDVETYFAFCLFFSLQDGLKEFTFIIWHLANVSEGLVSLKLLEFRMLFWAVSVPSDCKFFLSRNLVIWYLVISSVSHISPVSGTSRLTIQLAQIDYSLYIRGWLSFTKIVTFRVINEIWGVFNLIRLSFKMN